MLNLSKIRNLLLLALITIIHLNIIFYLLFIKLTIKTLNAKFLVSRARAIENRYCVILNVIHLNYPAIPNITYISECVRVCVRRAHVRTNL